MNKEQVLQILNCTAKNWEDTIIEKVFEHKQYLLKSVVTPPLFYKRSEKLLFLQECKNSLSEVETKMKLIDPEISFMFNTKKNLLVQLLEIYRSYENLTSQFKLKLMQSIQPFEVAQASFSLAKLESAKLEWLLKIPYPKIEIIEDVLLSTWVDSGMIIQEIKALNSDSNWNKILANSPTLKKDILRSEKYRNFTHQKKLKDA